jgi:hypothetical protein
VSKVTCTGCGVCLLCIAGRSWGLGTLLAAYTRWLGQAFVSQVIGVCRRKSNAFDRWWVENYHIPIASVPRLHPPFPNHLLSSSSLTPRSPLLPFHLVRPLRRVIPRTDNKPPPLTCTPYLHPYTQPPRCQSAPASRQWGS